MGFKKMRRLRKVNVINVNEREDKILGDLRGKGRLGRTRRPGGG